jgi:hypothetical protein
VALERSPFSSRAGGPVRDRSEAASPGGGRFPPEVRRGILFVDASLERAPSWLGPRVGGGDAVIRPPGLIIPRAWDAPAGPTTPEDSRADSFSRRRQFFQRPRDSGSAPCGSAPCRQHYSSSLLGELAAAGG